MLCGVKFCGGCNPRYDRGKALSAIKEHFREEPHFEFEYAEEAVEYDILLYIAGCVNRCTSLKTYRAARGTLCIWDETQIPEICARIDDILRLLRV